MANGILTRMIERLRFAASKPVALDPPVTGRVDLPHLLGAVLTRDASDLQRDLARDPAAAAHLHGVDLRVFAANSSDANFPVDAERASSLYGPLAACRFSRVWITRTMHLYDNPWGHSFLSHALSLLGDGGELIVPVDPSDRDRGIIGAGAAPRTLGAPLARATRSRFVFGGSSDVKPVQSILTWYFDHVYELVLEDLRMRTFGPGRSTLLSDVLCSEFLDESDELGRWSVREAEQETPADLDQAAGLAIRRQAYQVGGISQKSALMRAIIREHCGGDRPLRMSDMGGGYGLLSAELLLDPACAVSHAVNVDLSPYNLLLCAIMYRGMREELAGRYRFWFGGSQEYQPIQCVDVVSFIGSLLYVPRELTQRALERAWESLAPGGILVVHENIKDPKYVADYERMFTVEELDGYLNRFGAVTRYHQSAFEHRSAGEAGDKGVYRVVQKS